MSDAPSLAHDSLLYLDGVTVSFDGFRALDGMSLVLYAGELRTIIGPNGAGKTTMMDVITGKTRPDAGDVMFDGKVDLTRLDEAAIANLGIGRKFHKPTVFENLSVLDNLELALRNQRGIWHTLFARDAERVDEALVTIGLTAQRNDRAGSLSHGQKQWLEIGMLLVQDPQVLFLDEPVAGMTHQESERTAELVRSLAGDRTVVVVEHDMDFVRHIARTVTVLHEGSVLAEGSMDKVQADPKVIEVYLGT
jgi:urea transport system ATP-binding protein